MDDRAIPSPSIDMQRGQLLRSARAHLGVETVRPDPARAFHLEAANGKASPLLPQL